MKLQWTFFQSAAFLLAASPTIYASHTPFHTLAKREELPQCTDLSINSNAGNRKIALVIDCSLSMVGNDPSGYRVAAARSLNRFLLDKSEGGRPDQVAVIEFANDAKLLYGLGDPDGVADAAIAEISADTYGTRIYTGVQMAMDQLESGGGDTRDRSAIIVLTDGEDDTPDDLAKALQDADSKGIRVSFGFLSTSVGSQVEDILTAIRQTRGIYASIADASGSQNFVNYAILNGLTYNDNPQGYDERLLAGLGQTYTVSGSDSVTLKYVAQRGEDFNFTVTGITTEYLTATLRMRGQVLDTMGDTYSPFVGGTASSTGDVELEIKADKAPTDALFSVLTNSNIPFQNCTVGVSKGNGLSPGAKAGISVGVIGGVGLLATGGYFALQYMQSLHAPGAASGGPSGGEFQGHHDTFGGAEKAHPDVHCNPVDQTVHAPGAPDQTTMPHDPSSYNNMSGTDHGFGHGGGTGGADQTLNQSLGHGGHGGETGGTGGSGTQGGTSGFGDPSLGPQGGCGDPTSMGTGGAGGEQIPHSLDLGPAGPAPPPNMPPVSPQGTWIATPPIFVPPIVKRKKDDEQDQDNDSQALNNGMPSRLGTSTGGTDKMAYQGIDPADKHLDPYGSRQASGRSYGQPYPAQQAYQIQTQQALQGHELQYNPYRSHELSDDTYHGHELDSQQSNYGHAGQSHELYDDAQERHELFNGTQEGTPVYGSALYPGPLRSTQSHSHLPQ